MGTLRALFFIFEGSLLAIVGAKVMGEQLGRKSILLISLIYGVSVLGIRSLYQFLKIPFGSHTLILALLMLLLLWQMGKLPLPTATYSTLISFILLFVGEPLVALPLIKYFHLSFDKIMIDIFWFYVIGLASNSLLILTSLLYWLRRIYA